MYEYFSSAYKVNMTSYKKNIEQKAYACLNLIKLVQSMLFILYFKSLHHKLEKICLILLNYLNVVISKIYKLCHLWRAIMIKTNNS